MDTETFRVVKTEFENSKSIFLCIGSSTFDKLWSDNSNRSLIRKKAEQFLIKFKEKYSHAKVSYEDIEDSVLFMDHDGYHQIKPTRLAFLDWLIDNLEPAEG